MPNQSEKCNSHAISNRFRGFLPVVIDVETAGFNAKTDALLEIAAVIISMKTDGDLYLKETVHCNVEPFRGANLEASALEFTGIDPHSPFRNAQPEKLALDKIFTPIRKAVKETGCTRAVLVGHNATFDHNFVFAAAERANIKRNPFHPFSTFDTATLSGLAYGQTVLAKACGAAGIEFDGKAAHTAKYDTEKTAELFCKIVNKWQHLGGWPLSS
ncbi:MULTISPECIES: ribonuclease T [unclassified Oleiphilus]|nr:MULTISPECIES: ribonuclease T [unclassified Oleiphilus]KZY45233.1 ribonuclease T [Oleiphilus sp. HI0050]KZY77936.1 ribonuclease T [Oleiphilus sp. HI0068]KZY86289.1 ribonuclease T [Oleiphilus sp. HI0069]KZY97151.1 ribonuclease T [Oleiphilus sp. HI0072]KZZ09640.1 ribonuclease T [Oleiphilus sp. HI0078]KZZ23343.1 ribonuclease T [Oleiphilus sp. HI0081]KZZ33600.1 ribonuclease T [Oleiphilus sp. HI0085]